MPSLTFPTWSFMYMDYAPRTLASLLAPPFWLQAKCSILVFVFLSISKSSKHNRLMMYSSERWQVAPMKSSCPIKGYNSFRKQNPSGGNVCVSPSDIHPKGFDIQSEGFVFCLIYSNPNLIQHCLKACHSVHVQNRNMKLKTYKKTSPLYLWFES